MTTTWSPAVNEKVEASAHALMLARVAPPVRAGGDDGTVGEVGAIDDVQLLTIATGDSAGRSPIREVSGVG